jgi:hypothetical protein
MANGEQAGTGKAARDRARRCRALHHLLAGEADQAIFQWKIDPPNAGLLRPRHLDQLQPRRDHVEDLADVLAHQAQGTAAVWAVLAGVQFAALSRRVG